MLRVIVAVCVDRIYGRIRREQEKEIEGERERESAEEVY